MKPIPLAIVLLGLLASAGCDRGPRPRSEQSFDEIAARVAGRSAAEVTALLGEPDSRQTVFLRDQRWIWWNYTYLDGEDYPPEVRGRVVHLEITFRNPAGAGGAARPYSEWRVAQPFGVAYRTPGSPSAAMEPASALPGGM